MKYDTVIFDLDGTLLHTLDDLYYSNNSIHNNLNSIFIININIT